MTRPHRGGSDELFKYFTNAEVLQAEFREWIATPQPSKKILFVHGVGGIGKSSLLEMFRLHCRAAGIPIGLASGDEAKSIIAVLFGQSNGTRNPGWMRELEKQGVELRQLLKSYQRYKSLEARIQEHFATAKPTLDTADQAKSKLAESVGGAIGGVVIGSVLPVVGTALGEAVGGALGGAGTEALRGALSRKLSSEDIDFLLGATDQFASDLLVDLNRMPSNERIVLVLDTFEQVDSLDDWICEFAENLPENVLLVLAGRKTPDWSRKWRGWLSSVRIRQVEPMLPEDMRKLVRSYYATVNEGRSPDPAQVEQIVEFARGLPLVATSAVKLWVQWGIDDFQSVKAQVVADLIDLLMEGVGAELLPALEAAASVRWFDKSILRHLLTVEDVDAVYDELRHFPFVRPRMGGAFMLHDVIREMMNAHIKAQDPQRYWRLHSQAAQYFTPKASSPPQLPVNEEWQRDRLEQSFHLMKVDEDSGLDLLQALFNEGLAYFQYGFCANLLNDAVPTSSRTAQRSNHNRLRLRVAQWSPAFVGDSDFQELIANDSTDPQARWQLLLDYAEYLGFSARYKEQHEYRRKSLEALTSIGQLETGAGCHLLALVSADHLQRPSEREALIRRALGISEDIGARMKAYQAHVELGDFYLEVGRSSESERAYKAALEIAEEHSSDAMIADSNNRLAQVFMAQAELGIAQAALTRALKSAERLPDTLGARRDKLMYIQRHMAILAQIRREYGRAVELYELSSETYRERKSTGGLMRTLVLLAGCYYEAGQASSIASISPEIAELGAKISVRQVKAGEIAAGWHTIQGHLQVDALDDGWPRSNQDAVSHYFQAMAVGLGVQVAVLDEIVTRILWRLSLLRSNGQGAIADDICESLTSRWRNSENGESCEAVEGSQRVAFSEFSSVSEPGRSAIHRLSSATGTASALPAVWLSY